MRNIVLARIDDRLIHGQICTQWVKTTDANRIVIVDEALLKDTFMQRILKAAAPSGIQVDIVSINDAIKLLSEDSNENERIIVLSKTPQVMESLIEGGVKIKNINLGGMGYKAGRKRFNKNVSANEEEEASMQRMIDKGVEIIYQLVPSDSSMNVKKLLKEE